MSWDDQRDSPPMVQGPVEVPGGLFQIQGPGTVTYQRHAHPGRNAVVIPVVGVPVPYADHCMATICQVRMTLG